MFACALNLDDLNLFIRFFFQLVLMKLGSHSEFFPPCVILTFHIREHILPFRPTVFYTLLFGGALDHDK